MEWFLKTIKWELRSQAGKVSDKITAGQGSCKGAAGELFIDEKVLKQVCRGLRIRLRSDRVTIVDS
jgi:hypothetical protein